MKQEKDELGMYCTLVISFLLNFHAAASRNELQANPTSLTTSQSSSSTEVETLRHRDEDVEREKCDLVGVVSLLEEDSTHRDGKKTVLCIEFNTIT